MSVRHLVIRNPNFNNRIGCWNTIMLTACGQLLPPADLDRPELDKRLVTLRLDMVTCEICLAWARIHSEAFVDDGQGHRVTA